MSDDATVAATLDLTTALRAWLRARPEPSPVQAAALAYEIAALMAQDAPSEPQAFALVDTWAAGMKWQIHAFGIGREHP
jgi:hypothetical protein